MLLESGMQCTVYLHSFQNCPVINLQLLHSVQHLETEFLKKEPVQ